jgi:hypothetical protein
MVLSFLVAGVCVAQDVPEITGKVTLMSGTTYEGVIEVAEFGVTEGAGIGCDPSMAHGYMSVMVDGQEAKVPFADVASAEAKWVPPGTEAGAKWRIDTITITRKDGTQVVGKPHWMLFVTEARLKQADGTIARAYAFSSASPDFDPGTLLVKVEIGPGTGTTPEPTGTTTEPTGTTTEPTGTTTEPTGTTTEPTGTTTGPTGVEPVVTTPGPGTAVVGAPSQLTLTVVCPKCGEKITIVVDVSAKPGG